MKNTINTRKIALTLLLSASIATTSTYAIDDVGIMDLKEVTYLLIKKVTSLKANIKSLNKQVGELKATTKKLKSINSENDVLIKELNTTLSNFKKDINEIKKSRQIQIDISDTKGKDLKKDKKNYAIDKKLIEFLNNK